MLFSLKRRRLCHTVLAALRGAYGFAPAQAAISIAAKTARVPHGQRHHVSAAGSLARSCGCAARRPRSARHCFRDLLMTLDRLCRYSLSLAFCTENAALALRTPQDAALPCGGGHRSMARSSGGQGYVQHYSITKRPGEVVLPGTSFPVCSQAEEFFPETQAPAACAAARSVAFLRHENRRCRERRHGQPLRHACPA